MSDMEQNRKSQLNYQEYAVRTGNHLRETVQLPDTEYLRFRVRKFVESFKVINTRIPGAELTKLHTTVEIAKVSAI